LVELGLTHTEAKVYISLLTLKSATARDVHSASNIARQNIYQLLSDLEEKGLIEKVIAKPAKFRPIPAEEVISILLQRKNEENRQLRKKAVKQFRNFEIEGVNPVPFDKNAQFLLLSKSETNPAGHIDRLGKAVGNAKKTVMGLITLPLFMNVKLMDESVWKKAVKRGVKFKFIIGRKPNESTELNLDPALKNTDHFKVRWTSSFPSAAVLLVDEREAFCRIGVKAETPVLWSATPNFVAMVKDYLKTKWRSL
jgi:sugar-specific transcriptional regulator TrmB